MHWKEIDPQNLPTGELVIASFKPGSFDYGKKILGEGEDLAFRNGRVSYQNAKIYRLLDYCTHYIDIGSETPISIQPEQVGEDFRGRSVKQSIKPVHPGEILLDYMQDFGMTVDRLSQLLGVTLETIKEAITGLQPIPADLASRIGTALGMGID